jgi:hypothetical protein
VFVEVVVDVGDMKGGVEVIWSKTSRSSAKGSWFILERNLAERGKGVLDLDSLVVNLRERFSGGICELDE